MPSILVRDLDDKIVGRLKAIAKHHGRSLQGEVKAILTETVSFLTMEAAAVSAVWRKKLKGRRIEDSSDMIRKDRER
jgi:antitoxin FitA